MLTFFCTLMLVACVTKDYGAESFRNYTAKQILAGGEKAIASHNYKDSIKYFEAIDALYPFDYEAQQGQLNVIYAYYKTEDYASALAAADRYIHLYPVGRHTDYAYYMKGLINSEKDRTPLQKMYKTHLEELDLANLQEAFVDFGTLVKSFPKSVYVKDAKKRMRHIRYALAQHELQTAKFYFERKAYIAAANRANYVVKHFADTPQEKEALKIMIKSYRILGVTEKERNARRILNLNFPGSQV